MSPEVVALLVLAAAAAVAVAFTVIIVATVEPSSGNARLPDGPEGTPQREKEER